MNPFFIFFIALPALEIFLFIKIGGQVGALNTVALIFLTAILSGLVTSFCGPVAFLGVLVPHLARKIFQTGDHKVLLPSVMILGSIIALFSEALSSLTDPISLPLNAILGVMGFPALIIFLLKNKKQQEEDL